MKVISLSEKYREDCYNIATSSGCIFYTPKWIDMFKDQIKHYVILNNADQVIGGFFLYKDKKLGINLYQNPPYTPTIGPFFITEATNLVSKINFTKKIISLMAEALDKFSSSGIISLRIDRNIIDMQPFIWRKFKVIPCYTYILNLELSIDTLFRQMSNERKKNIRKALKDGLKTERAKDIKLLRTLIMKTFDRQKKSINQYFLDKILNEFFPEQNSFAFFTYWRKHPVACAYCVYDQETAYYLFGGYDYELKHHGAGTLALWECIKHAKNIGLKKFDFEGSMLPHIERYFRGFGGEIVPFYAVNKAMLPLEILLKFFRREYF